MASPNPYFEIGTILGLATLLGFAGQRLRQPLVIMFLAAGILAGPAALGLITSHREIGLLANIGIALLLFIVGLKLDLHFLRTNGPAALTIGLGQIGFTALIGWGITLALGLPHIDAIYTAIALTFSSTIIIVKLLSDKKEIDSFHGHIVINVLIVQDLAAILVLVGITTIGARGPGATASSMLTMLVLAAKGLGFLAGVVLLTRFVLPVLTRHLARSQELLTLFAVAWAVLLGVGGEWLGFTKEVGAFLAGVSLASTGYRDAIGARLTSLRDFLLLFFFIDLGARLEWSTVGAQLPAAAVLAVFVLVGNPLIVMVIMGGMGYRRRTGFLVGLTVAQISEFSLIMAALGVALGHIRPETMGLITLVGVVTIFASTYLILYATPLYRRLAGVLRIFERRHPHREAAASSLPQGVAVDVILVGLGNYGGSLADYLLRRGRSFLGVDFDPSALAHWQKRNLPVIYGDMADPEIYDQLPLTRAHWVICTIRSPELGLLLLQNLRQRGFGGRIALTAADDEEAGRYRQAGVQVVLRPFLDAAEQAADALTDAMDLLPDTVDWPIAFCEARLRPESAVVGQRIRDIPLRSLTGVSILAVSRAGRVLFDPGPDAMLYPGDRVVLMGTPDELRRAESLFSQLAPEPSSEPASRFEIAEVKILPDGVLAGQTLATLRFRQRYEVTVIGLRRGNERIMTVDPTAPLLAGDRLMVIGTEPAVERLKDDGLVQPGTITQLGIRPPGGTITGITAIRQG